MDREAYGGFGSSELPIRKFVFELNVSEVKRKNLPFHHKTLQLDIYLLQFAL